MGYGGRKAAPEIRPRPILAGDLVNLFDDLTANAQGAAARWARLPRHGGARSCMCGTRAEAGQGGWGGRLGGARMSHCAA